MKTHGTAPVLALDIGGTKLATAVVAADGTVHGLHVEPTRVTDGVRPVLNRLFAMGHDALAEAGVPRPAAVGISCGGPLDARRGLLLGPLHLPGWDEVPVGPMATEAFGAPFVLENDATAAAWGEHRFGLGRQAHTLLYLTLSTGVGGGVVVNGRLHRGAAGNGGELGHVTVRSGGRRCSCPRRGCLEAYCSGTSIAERARELLVDGPESSLGALTTVTAKDVVAAVRAGDEAATHLWDETTELLGEGLVTLTNVLEPDLVVLGGGVANAGTILLDPVRRLVRTRATSPVARICRVEIAQQPDTACIIGAGAIALDRPEVTETDHHPRDTHAALDQEIRHA